MLAGDVGPIMQVLVDGVLVGTQEVRATDPTDHGAVHRALAAHLCRCTGWQTVVEAWDRLGDPVPDRDLDAASQRATLTLVEQP